MKAISVKQPWASLIVHGIKDIENRTWVCPQKYIGKRVLIHASAGNKFNINLNDEQMTAAFPLISKKSVLEHWDFGAIIGSIKIVSCVQNHPSVWAEKTQFYVELEEGVYLTSGKGDPSRTVLLEHAHLYASEQEANRALLQAKKYRPFINAKVIASNPIYNWVLSDPILFDKPIAAKGKLSFWNFDIPKDGRHHHYWIEDGILYETYSTIRGNRYRELYKVNYPDIKTVNDEELSRIEILNA